MARNCKLSIKIADGSICDAETSWGLYLVDSDDLVISPIKPYEVQSYPEYAAVEIYPYTTKEPFDYKVTLMKSGDLSTVNTSVNAFYDSLFEVSSGVDLRQAKVITIYNHWKGVQVSGYAKTSPATGNYPQLVEAEKGAYIFDLILQVADPKTLAPYNGT